MNKPLKLTKESPSRIKRAALELFARRGIKAVTVRQIAAEAGQKNSASIGYHFGSKEALITELIEDSAKIIDDRRYKLVKEAIANGDINSMYCIVEMLVYPSLNISETGEKDVFNRFLTALTFDNRATLMAVLEGRLDESYKLCLGHLRELMPEISVEEQNQRFAFIESYIGSVLSAREARLLLGEKKQSMWTKPDLLEHLVRSVVAILKMPAK